MKYSSEKSKQIQINLKKILRNSIEIFVVEFEISRKLMFRFLK